MRNPQEVPVLKEPEPLLLRFLRKYVVETIYVADGEIHLRGNTPQNQERKAILRTVTAEEFDQTEKWINKVPEILEEFPMLNVNFEQLKAQRSKIPSPTEPFL